MKCLLKAPVLNKTVCPLLLSLIVAAGLLFELRTIPRLFSIILLIISFWPEYMQFPYSCTKSGVLLKKS